jgi:cytochrome c5
VKFNVLVCLVVGFLSALTAQAQDMSDDAIKARIQPVGNVHIAGVKAPGNANAGPRSGADIYAKSCVACHTSGVLGAPKLQDAADWAPRLEKGFDAIWQSAIKGINAMPPMGTCSSCSDDDIKAAIEYMIEGL